MYRFDGMFKRFDSSLMMLLVTAFVAGCGGGGSGGSLPAGFGPGPAGTAPALGTAGTYGIFASDDAAITLAVDSRINGDVGLMDGLGTCGNCTATTVSGAINNGGAAAAQAQSDFVAAYNDASTRSTNACTLAAPTNLAQAQGACTGVTPSTPGPTYGPGLYRTALAIGFSGTITLDGGGGSNGVFIFQTDSALTTATNSRVVLTNGAQAGNVFWVAGAAATLGVSSTFKGTVIAPTAGITVNGGTITEPTDVEGRLASGAAVTVGTFSTVTVPQ